MATSAHLTTVSLLNLSNPDSSTYHREISRLLKICETSGFFLLSNHGIPYDLISRAVQASRRFFKLPVQTKEVYGQHAHPVKPATCRGYANAEVLSPISGVDKKELFDLGVDHPFIPGKRFTGPNLLPPDNVAPDFASSLLELQDHVMSRIAPVLYRAFGEALDVGPDFFCKYMTDPTLIQRVLYYPSECGTAGKHTDNGLFTILIQEESSCKSLQVYTEEEWIEVEASKDLLVVNLGDILQFWTGGRFVSTPHLVQHSGDKDRVSLPFFIYPDIDRKFVPFGDDSKEIAVVDVMDKNFENIWELKRGAGRTRELNFE